MSVIKPETVLVDASGTEWRRGPHYQEREPGAFGWLEMESGDGELLTYAKVVDFRGFRDGRIVDERGAAKPYLVGYLADPDPQS